MAAQRGYAVAALRDSGRWQIEPLPPAVRDDLDALLRALRAQPPEGGPFVIAAVNNDFFVVARQEGARIQMFISDLTASVDYRLAEQVLARLGEDPPTDDELEEVWPFGDLDMFEDLDLTEEEMEEILDDLDAQPEEMLETIVERIGLFEEFDNARRVAEVTP